MRRNWIRWAKELKIAGTDKEKAHTAQKCQTLGMSGIFVIVLCIKGDKMCERGRALSVFATIHLLYVFLLTGHII